MSQLTDARSMPEALPARWAAHLIAKMRVMYGAKFTQQWEGVDPVFMQAEWAKELAGFTGQELAAGLDACRERPYPPTLPEFMVLCRPPLNPEVAFHEAVHCTAQRRRGELGDWTHPAIYHAAVKVGQHDILNCAYATLKARWNKALADELARREWEPVPDAVQALPEPRKTAMSDAQAKKAMQKLGAADVLNKSGQDPRAWARKILANPKGRSPTVIRMAQEALECEVAA